MFILRKTPSFITKKTPMDPIFPRMQYLDNLNQDHEFIMKIHKSAQENLNDIHSITNRTEKLDLLMIFKKNLEEVIKTINDISLDHKQKFQQYFPFSLRKIFYRTKDDKIARNLFQDICSGKQAILEIFSRTIQQIQRCDNPAAQKLTYTNYPK